MERDAAAASQRAQIDRPRIKEAVLGLLVASKGPKTPSELRVELHKRLRSADLRHNYVYWVLKTLAEQGLVIEGPKVEDTIAQVATDRRRSTTRKRLSQSWEVAPAGVAHFQNWMQSRIPEPGLRDEVLIRVEFCQRHEIPQLVARIDELEKPCLDQIDILQADDIGSQAYASDDEIAWQHKKRVIRRDAELEHWRGRVEWLRGIKKNLSGC